MRTCDIIVSVRNSRMLSCGMRLGRTHQTEPIRTAQRRYVLELILLTIAVATVTFCGIQICRAQPSDESAGIEVTEWMDPTGRQPITYAEWAGVQPPHREAMQCCGHRRDPLRRP